MVYIRRMNTIGAESRRFFQTLKYIYEEAEAWSVTQIVFEYVLGLSRVELTTRTEDQITQKDKEKLDLVLIDLINDVPVQHITRRTWFYGMELEVSPAVLIPRRETEELVDWIASEIKAAPELIVDFCTGSGCIALALKKIFPDSKVSGVDVSYDALLVAGRNAKKNSLEVEWLLLDMERKMPEFSPGLIVSNPPYVTRKEESALADRVVKNEPSLALFVSDEDPLLFYRIISTWALKHAGPGTPIYYEINEAMGNKISELHSQLGFIDSGVKKDMQGKDRFFKTFVPKRI